MTPIEYVPVALEGMVNSPYGSKRLKNRTGSADCRTAGCEMRVEGFVLDVVEEAKTHDRKTGHTIVVAEDPCRLGLVIQSTGKGGE